MTSRTAYQKNMPFKGLLDRIDALHYSAEAAAQNIQINPTRPAQTPWRSPDELLESPAESVAVRPDEQAIPQAPASPELPGPEAIPSEHSQATASNTTFSEAHAEETWDDNPWSGKTDEPALLNPSQLSAPDARPRSRSFMLVVALAIGIGISLPATFLTIFYFRNYAPELQATAAHKVLATKVAGPTMAPIAKDVQPAGPTTAPKLVLKPIPVRVAKASGLTTVAAIVRREPSVTVKPAGEKLASVMAPLSASRDANRKPARFVKAGALTTPMALFAPGKAAAVAAPIRLIVLRELTVVAGDSISLPARLDPPPRIPNAGRVLIRGLPDGFSVTQAKKSANGAWVLDPRALAAARIHTPKTASGLIRITIALAGKTDEALARAGSAINVVSAPDAKRLSTTEADTLVQRGDALMASGDIDAARLLFRLAAEGSSGVGAFKLAETFDPNIAKRSADAAWSASLERARAWYMRAAVLGDKTATQRLRTLPSP